jgi:hypothetical protein
MNNVVAFVLAGALTIAASSVALGQSAPTPLPVPTLPPPPTPAPAAAAPSVPTVPSSLPHSGPLAPPNP